MVTIDYFGIAPESIELINSEEFRAVLEAHPNLRLVKNDPEAYDKGEEIFLDVTLPLPEDHDDYVGVEDRDNDDAFMWILYDDCDMVSDPSPAFIEVLKVMDTFSFKTLGERLFSPQSSGRYMDDPALLAAEYDFTTGEYIL
jgi:hypothetical protein